MNKAACFSFCMHIIYMQCIYTEKQMDTNFKALPVPLQEKIAEKLQYADLKSMVDHERQLLAFKQNDEMFISPGASVEIALRSSQIHQKYWGKKGVVKAKRIRIYQVRTFDFVVGVIGEFKSVSVPVDVPEVFYYLVFPDQDLAPINLQSQLVKADDANTEITL